MIQTCLTETCKDTVFAKGLCRKHYNRKWHAENREYRKQYCKSKNSDRLKVQSEWYVRNKELHNAKSKQHYLLHKGEYKAKKLKRISLVKKSTPAWVDKNEINKIYKNCPPGFHVDHIVPINGINVCGLHVPWNLQYLSAKENLRKGNRLREEDIRLIQSIA